MPKGCGVPCCSGIKKSRNVYRLPSEKNTLGKTDEKKKGRRQLWLQAIFGTICDVPDNFVVCEIHFLTGKPVLKEEHSDWVPSLNLPQKEVPKNSKIVNSEAKLNTLQGEISHAGHVPQNFTNVTMLVATENATNDVLNRLLMKEDEMEQNQEAFEYYTGLPFHLGKLILELLAPVLKLSKHTCSLTPFQEFMLAMMKLRLNLQFTDLGYRFNIDRRTASRVFYKWIDLMYYQMKCVVRWPSREEILSNMPTSFKNTFGDKITVILDCLCFDVETSDSPEIASEARSSSRHHNCIKYLLGITPQGYISFISKAYGGTASNTFITEDCGVLNNFLESDFVLTGRGFSNLESVGIYMVQPTFARDKGKNQLHPSENTRAIANVRVHVGRVIRVLRQRYKLLSNVLPHHLLNQSSNEGVTAIDKILTVCCALVNNSSAIFAI